MNRKMSQSFATVAALSLVLAATGCSTWQNFVQGTKDTFANKASSSASTATSNALSMSPSGAQPAGSPASVSAAGNAAAANAQAAVGTSATGAIPSNVDTSAAAKAAANSPECKNASAGPCKSWVDQGHQGNIAAAFCAAACVENICGQSALAQTNAANAKSAGLDCGLGN